MSCSPKTVRLPLDEFSRPQRVLVITIDRPPARVSSWRPGMSIGIGFGSFGSSVGGGVDMTHQRDGAEGIRAYLDSWDFRDELHRFILSRLSPPGAWMWVNGDTVDEVIQKEIDDLYDRSKAKAPKTAAYASANGIDKIFIVDPISWGIKRDEGLFVELRGRLFQPTEDRQLVWEGYGKPARPRRPFFESGPESARDQETIRQAVMESAAEAANDLLRELQTPK